MDRGAWWATVHGVAKSQARLSDFTYFKSSCQKRPQLKGKHQRGFLGNTEKAAVWCVISSSVKTEVTHWRLKLCIHLIERLRLQKYSRGLEMVFSGGASGKESACSAGDLCSILGSGRSPGEGNGKPLQYSCLENPNDRGARWATVHGIARV